MRIDPRRLGSVRRSLGVVKGGAYRGIAPNAPLINLRVRDPNGMGVDGSVIAAIQRAIQLK